MGQSEYNKLIKRLMNSVDWDRNLTDLSNNLLTTEGWDKIHSDADSQTKGPSRNRARKLRGDAVIEALKRAMYPCGIQSIPLALIINNIYNSDKYNQYKQSCWDNEKKIIDAIKWDITRMCFHGKAAKLPLLTPASSS